MEKAEAAKVTKLNDQIKSRMENQKQHFGKMDMQRSKKPKVKQLVVKKIIDEDTMDQITYLGNDLKSLAEAAKEVQVIPGGDKN